MVALAENYAIEVEKARIRKAAAAAATDSSSSSSSSASIESDEAWNQQMQNVGTLAAGMGIVSPVTKSIAGSAYTSELARQISVVLRPHLQRRGGVISLTDAFCFVNRARGTEVVSPEDLLEASQLLLGLKLGMRMTSITVENNEQGKGGKGGGGGSFRAIQLDTFSDAAVTSRILKLFDERKDNVETRGEHYYPFVTAHEITKLMGIPLPFVKQILLQAEKNAILCRDESIAGLRFFKNLMVSL
jgi:ESCRT-II complex subunit VPS36